MSAVLEVGKTYTTRGGMVVKLTAPTRWGHYLRDAVGRCWELDGCHYMQYHAHHESIDLDDPVNGGAPEFPIFML
jgi:hypothetical protein